MSEYNKGKKWSEPEENTLINLIKNGKTLEECSKNLGRTIGAIKIRIEEIIYKKNVYENQPFNKLLYLKKHIDIHFEDIIKKYENKYKNKIDNNCKKDFETNVLNELEKIKLKQEEISLHILKEKGEEIERLNLIINDLKDIKKKNENTIAELINVIKKINVV